MIITILKILLDCHVKFCYKNLFIIIVWTRSFLFYKKVIWIRTSTVPLVVTTVSKYLYSIHFAVIKSATQQKPNESFFSMRQENPRVDFPRVRTRHVKGTRKINIYPDHKNLLIQRVENKRLKTFKFDVAIRLVRWKHRSAEGSHGKKGRTTINNLSLH